MIFAQAASVLTLTVPGRADDLEAGKAQFLKSCGTCHSAEPGAAPRQGPNLHGVIGRKAGTLPGFTYSPALQSWGEVWTEDLLEPWITNAQLTRPGTVMNYRQADEDKRKLIIQYLKSLSAK
ncbi:c-type cytochrome [Hyphomicrobiaceae bacterium 22]|uniref:C-type cytochrome n=2 Tax=Prosthecodimorpha staleyi TaxID=2840188 RepID=A0A947GFH0_9HYPH|nr:c-type cytochrome [Prosthecodimorpha staleyi]